MTKKSRQKLKYLKKEKSFQDEIKSIFHHLRRAIIEANKKKESGFINEQFTSKQLLLLAFIFPSPLVHAIPI